MAWLTEQLEGEAEERHGEAKEPSSIHICIGAFSVWLQRRISP